MSQIELTATVRNLKELMMLKADLDAEIEVAQDTIKAEMTAQDTEEIIVDVFKVRWTKVISNRFNTTSFKSAHKDIYDLFTKPVEIRRFSIA